jgi:hypothetical protein
LKYLNIFKLSDEIYRCKILAVVILVIRTIVILVFRTVVILVFRTVGIRTFCIGTVDHLAADSLGQLVRTICFLINRSFPEAMQTVAARSHKLPGEGAVAAMLAATAWLARKERERG